MVYSMVFAANASKKLNNINAKNVQYDGLRLRQNTMRTKPQAFTFPLVNRTLVELNAADGVR